MDGQQFLWMTSASPSTFRQNNVTLGASLSLVRGHYLINDTLCYAIFVNQAFEFSYKFKNIEFLSLLLSFEHCKFYFIFLPISLIISHSA